MGNNKTPQIVSLNGKEYDIEKFTDQQKFMLEHCVDLDRKLASCKFQMDQLLVGKDAFLGKLIEMLEQEKPAEQ